MREWMVYGSIVCGLGSTLLGGFDTILMAMLLLMVVDMAAGIVCVIFFQKSKYTAGGLSSDAMIKGTVRKLSMLAVIVVGVVIDRALDFEYVRNTIVMYFIATEGISILEHMAIIGVPLPQFLMKLLEVIKEQNDNPHKNGGENNG